jgi:hypothetical protein
MSNPDSLVTIEMNPYTRGHTATKGAVSWTQAINITQFPELHSGLGDSAQGRIGEISILGSQPSYFQVSSLLQDPYLT